MSNNKYKQYMALVNWLTAMLATVLVAFVIGTGVMEIANSILLGSLASFIASFTLMPIFCYMLSDDNDQENNKNENI